MPVIRPEGTPLSREQQTKLVAGQIEQAIAHLARELAQHLYQRALIKAGEHEEHPDIREIGETALGDAMRWFEFLRSRQDKLEAFSSALAADYVARHQAPGSALEF